MSVPTARAKLRSALRDARGAVAALSLTAFRSHPSCDPVPTRRAAMATALALRCLYRAQPARLCPFVYPLW